MGYREFRFDSKRDPDGTRLRAELEAQFARDRIALWREILEHLAVLLAIVLWLALLGLVPAWARAGAILLFVPLVAGLLLTCIAEWRA
jgi:hypothetical protein